MRRRTISSHNFWKATAILEPTFTVYEWETTQYEDTVIKKKQRNTRSLRLKSDRRKATDLIDMVRDCKKMMVKLLESDDMWNIKTNFVKGILLQKQQENRIL